MHKLFLFVARKVKIAIKLVKYYKAKEKIKTITLVKIIHGFCSK
jgi:hypothetical protein